MLRTGGYRSSKIYLSAIKRMHITAGFVWSDLHVQTMADARRACERGLGPAEQADPLPIDDIVEVAKQELMGTIRPTWPAVGLDAAVVSCAWLLREIESSLAVRRHVELFDPPEGEKGCSWVRWTLPASKTDPKAQGVKRSLACACPSSLCPVAAMRRVCKVSEAVSLAMGRTTADGPLLPRKDGKVLTKRNVESFYENLAEMVGYQGRITGHSARVTGAMRMAYAGHSEWAIQLFGRWGANTVLRYIREALLGKAGGHIAQITEGVLPDNASIDTIRKYVREMVSRYLKGKIEGKDMPVFEGAAITAVEEKMLQRVTVEKCTPKGEELTRVITERMHEMGELLTEKPTTLRHVRKHGGIRHTLWAGDVAHCGNSFPEEQVVTCNPPEKGH